MSSNPVIKKIKYAMRYIPDKPYVQLYYLLRLRKICHLDNPKTYTEKVNWLKLYYRDPMLTKLVDKYEVKDYVAGLIGEEYIIPTLGAWDRFDDIDFDMLPSSFVLKCNHDSGGLVIVKDKSKLDKVAAKRKIENALKHDFYYDAREWPYKNVRRKIFAEKYMEDSVDNELRDYKFFCFNGVPRLLLIIAGRYSNSVSKDFYDMQFNHQDIKLDCPNCEQEIHEPQNFMLMKELATKLSEKYPTVRVDFFEANGKVYFGELTFYPRGGFMQFKPQEWDQIMGNWLTLPSVMKG